MKVLSKYLLIILAFIAINTSAKSDLEREVEEFDQSVVIDRINNEDIEVVVPALVFTFKDAKIKLKFNNPQHTKLLLNDNKLHFIINGEDYELTFVNGESAFNHRFNDGSPLSIYIEEFSYNKKISAFPLWAVLLLPGILLAWFIGKKTKKRKK